MKLPECIQRLKNLVKLKLRSTRITEHDAALQVLGNLPNLAFLHLLKQTAEGENVRLSFQQGMFPSLVVLELSMGLFERLRSVKFEQGTTPNLEVLKVCTCTSRTTLINSGSVLGLPSLSSLKEVVLEGDYNDSQLAYLRAEVAENPHRPVVKRV